MPRYSGVWPRRNRVVADVDSLSKRCSSSTKSSTCCGSTCSSSRASRKQVVVSDHRYRAEAIVGNRSEYWIVVDRRRLLNLQQGEGCRWWVANVSKHLSALVRTRSLEIVNDT